MSQQETPTLTFISPEETPRGTVFSLLSRAYASYREVWPERYAYWEGKWREADDFAYRDPAWSAGWMFLTKLETRIIGFACWDPRPRPQAVIGHNCIVFEFRGREFGVAQLNEVLRRLREGGFTEAVVTTGEESFFLPARRMYQRCGFVEVARKPVNEPFDAQVIEYRVRLV